MNLEDLGIDVFENFITETEEQLILKLIEQYPGTDRTSKSQPSRMIRFGQFNKTEGLVNDSKLKEQGYSGNKRRSYGEMNDGIDVSVNTMPKVIEGIGEDLFYLGMIHKIPEVCVINKYLPGVGIGKHIDHDDNGPLIPVIGLGSNAVMILSKDDKRILFF